MTKRILTALFLAFLSVPLMAQENTQAEADTLLAEFEGDFQPAEERWANGWVNWTEGFYYGVGEASVNDNRGSKARAMRAAKVVAQGQILTIASKIRVDGDNTLEGLAQKNAKIQLRAIVQGSFVKTEKITKGKDVVYKAIFKAPIRGVEGLTKKLLPFYYKKAVVPAAEAKRSDDRKASVEAEPKEDASADYLLVDARNLKQPVNPSLFPKVLDEDGKTVYSTESADADVIEEKGTALFATSDKPVEELLNGLITQDLYIAKVSDGMVYEWDGTPMMLAQADTEKKEPIKKKKKRRRKKKKPFIITSAKNAAGLQHADIVISKKDALAIANDEKSSSVLKNARVIILVDKSIGGVEGQLLLDAEELLAMLVNR